MFENKQLFDFMLRRVREVGAANGLKPPQAFARWFVEMYFKNPHDIFISDGSGDAKVDLFFNSTDGSSVEHYVVNTKFTEKYGALAPVAFYDEVNAFWRAFANKGNRATYLSSVVREELRPHYKKLFHYYDQGNAELFFVTNNRRNDAQAQAVKSSPVHLVHLEDVLQFMVDYIEDAMPHTGDLLLTGISTVLSAGQHDSEVPTSIVFARLADFIKYMENDPYDLLFARNVRLSLGNTPVNNEIRTTFQGAPKEFAFSNNGITVLCERLVHDPGAHEVRIANPRIVNGSQTLHSIRDVPNPSQAARVMVRIIEIPPLSATDLSTQSAKRKDIIHKISIRSNRQNDIKKWDLVSNDDFQNELSRYFRTKHLYYERRKREWAHRRTELKSLNVRQGPGIRALTQLMASFYWNRKLLGPVAAKAELKELFDGKQYEQIKETAPELAYQLYLIEEGLSSCVRELSDSKHYIANLSRHMNFTLFSVAVKTLEAVSAPWGSTAFTEMLENTDFRGGNWLRFAKCAVDYIRTSYKGDSVRYKRAQGNILPLPNYFKSRTYIAKILSRPLSANLRSSARAVLTDAL